MTTPEDDSNDGRQRHDHPRPVRFTREVRLPLAVRKELLITRAALERYDAVQALHQVKGGARRMTSLGAWLPRATSLARPGGWLKMLGITKDYPMLSTAITLALPLLRRTPVGRVAWKLSKLGAVAGAGYFAYKTWNEMQRAGRTRPVHVAPEVAVPAPVALDTGFRDPLVRTPPV
ncbi:DUF3318 domain-containing protein [Cupriavidus agavae]|uniref:Uncharacterized protein DUF3318 n=1 Tax=Cupriavidus agavae TaxID=1001822 RepID=A0A4V2FHT6_9BURK|nr:DUF3318 domain-containing protein [Cupriavidus agavae]RZT41409.1 uncharacterized protein DUF3318 [Cupriavidus agavae]